MGSGDGVQQLPDGMLLQAGRGSGSAPRSSRRASTEGEVRRRETAEAGCETQALADARVARLIDMRTTPRRCRSRSCPRRYRIPRCSILLSENRQRAFRQRALQNEPTLKFTCDRSNKRWRRTRRDPRRTRQVQRLVRSPGVPSVSVRIPSDLTRPTGEHIVVDLPGIADRIFV